MDRMDKVNRLINLTDGLMYESCVCVRVCERERGGGRCKKDEVIEEMEGQKGDRVG